MFSFYDLEEENIKLKFHREKDRILCQVESQKKQTNFTKGIYFEFIMLILCQTVELGRPGEGMRTVGEEDVSVYVVDPREKVFFIDDIQAPVVKPREKVVLLVFEYHLD